jgi:integrase
LLSNDFKLLSKMLDTCPKLEGGMRSKITKTSVDRMQPWSVLWDSEVKGFGIRRHGTDGRHYLLRYRFNGRQTFKKIGRHGSPWTPDAARAEALRLLGQIVSGVNPAQRQPDSVSFGAEIDRYLAQRQGNVRAETFRQLTLHLRKHSAPLHGLALSEIDRRRIAQLLAQVETGSGAVSRNRLRSSLSAFWGWLIREGLLDANPVAGTGVADEGPSRDRVLTERELAEVWRKGSEVIRLLILTGQRRDEIAFLHWHEVDLARKLIVLPSERTKNKVKHELPLSRQALAILRLRPRSEEMVFDRISWSYAKEQLDKSLKNVAPFKLHDIRRTVATGMAELGIQPHIIEAILNHVSGHKSGVAGIYNRAKYEGEMRSALQRWTDHLDKITA